MIIRGLSRYKFGHVVPKLIPTWAPYKPTCNPSWGFIARPIYNPAYVPVSAAAMNVGARILGVLGSRVCSGYAGDPGSRRCPGPGYTPDRHSDSQSGLDFDLDSGSYFIFVGAFVSISRVNFRLFM